MSKEVFAVPAVVRFTRKAPAKMNGQTPYPIRSNAASAIPVGGHSSVALG
jgi:hypothetical protein